MQLLSLGKGAGGTGKQDQYDSWFQQRHQWQGYKHRDGLKKFQGAVRSDCRHGEVFLKFHTKDKEISVVLILSQQEGRGSHQLFCLCRCKVEQDLRIIYLNK